MRPLMIVEVINEPVRVGDSSHIKLSPAQKRKEQKEKRRAPEAEMKNPTWFHQILRKKEKALEAFLSKL